MTEKTKELVEFLTKLEHRQPTLHDAITKYELKRKGWSCKDNSQEVQLMRLISLAAQKFIANVGDDSLGIYKQRRHQTLARLKEQGLKDQKTVLTLEDTAVALQEYGINLKPVPYYLDPPSHLG